MMRLGRPKFVEPLLSYECNRCGESMACVTPAEVLQVNTHRLLHLAVEWDKSLKATTGWVTDDDGGCARWWTKSRTLWPGTIRLTPSRASQVWSIQSFLAFISLAFLHRQGWVAREAGVGLGEAAEVEAAATRAFDDARVLAVRAQSGVWREGVGH